MKTVFCYGDSNTYGYDPVTMGRYPKEKLWTTLLQNKLGSEYYVANEGLNGRTTAFDREDEVFKNGLSSIASCICTRKPVDIAVFMLGTNDCNVQLGLTKEQIADGMERLLLLAFDVFKKKQEYMPRVIIVAPAAIGPNWQNSFFAGELNDESVRKSYEIAPLYKELAKKYGCEFLDCTEILKVSDVDSEHLTEESHRRLAELLFEMIEEKKTDYDELCLNLQAISEGVKKDYSLLANASALIYAALNDINWCGFYIAGWDRLYLAPFQGKVACTEIEFGKGVCGTAVKENRTVLVKNVHEFEGHIACDCASNSEIVVPIRKNGKIYGVLDIDSPSFNRFSEEDRAGLEAVCAVIEKML